IDRCVASCNFGANFFARPRLKFALMEDGSGVSKTEYPQSNEEAGSTVGPAIYGHSGSAAAITLAAVYYEQSATAPVEPERYSSRGPVTHYFGPVESNVAAAELGEPEVLQKPNVTATDCASTTFFASFVAGSGWHFCGTSEAAPHAAAVAALMRQTQPLATPIQILGGLESSATPFSGTKGGPTAVGAGLVNAEAAIEAVGGVAVNDPAGTVVGAVEESVAPSAQGTAVTPAGSTESAGTTVNTKSNGKPISGSGDTKGKPKAKIVAHPKALERTRGSSIVGRFRLVANQKGVSFFCQVDKTAARPCGARFRRRFGIGRHTVKVRAVDSADNASSVPASFRFRVQRIGR